MPEPGGAGGRGRSPRKERAPADDARPAADVFARRLLDWFEIHGRHDLPWQAVRDPYRIWVSEIMLQQTQVTTVIAYFERFVERFPDVGALAASTLDDVLALWSGLGYYARARNLHRAARIVVDEHGGSMPRSLDALTSLPGIGRSTAAAILALTWNEPAAILDGNVKRVLARFHGVRGWPGRSAVSAELWRLAEMHTPADAAQAYTQAIMDLGATVCIRGQARCEACPVAADCVALAEGTVAALPERRPRRARPQRECTVLLLHDEDGSVLLERRPPSGIWGGLLSLPELPEGATPEGWCRDTLGIVAIESARLAPVEHGFTHFDLRLQPVVMTAGGSAAAEPQGAPTAGAAVFDGNRWLWYNIARPLPGGVAAPIERLLRRSGEPVTPQLRFGETADSE